jgi:CTD small phosphatase-like protein 2
LYRCSTTEQNGVFLKDLSKLGRNLAKTLIVDNNPENFLLQPENGIYIKSWYENPEDTALPELSNLLIQLRN